MLEVSSSSSLDALALLQSCTQKRPNKHVRSQLSPIHPLAFYSPVVLWCLCPPPPHSPVPCCLIWLAFPFHSLLFPAPTSSCFPTLSRCHLIPERHPSSDPELSGPLFCAPMVPCASTIMHCVNYLYVHPPLNEIGDMVCGQECGFKSPMARIQNPASYQLG